MRGSDAPDWGKACLVSDTKPNQTRNMETTQLPDDAISTTAAAHLLKVHPSTVVRWVMSGKLPGWKVEGRFLVSRADVLARVIRVAPAKPAPPPVFDDAARRKWVEEGMKRWGLPLG